MSGCNLLFNSLVARRGTYFNRLNNSALNFGFYERVNSKKYSTYIGDLEPQTSSKKNGEDDKQEKLIKRLNLTDLNKFYNKGQKITMLTAHDYFSAKCADMVCFFVLQEVVSKY